MCVTSNDPPDLAESWRDGLGPGDSTLPFCNPVMTCVWQLIEQLWALPGSLMQQLLEELLQKLL